MRNFDIVKEDLTSVVVDHGLDGRDGAAVLLCFS